MKELYMLKPESQKIVIDRLTDFARKDDYTVNAFYFLYGVAKSIDGIATGEEFYNYLQNKSSQFLYNHYDLTMEYMKKIDKNSDLYKIGKRLICTMGDAELGAVFYNNHNKEEIVKIFNEELF